MILLQEHNLEIELLHEHSLLTIRWVGLLQAEEFTVLKLHLLEFANAHCFKNILIDASHSIESPAMQENWARNFLPQVLADTAIEECAWVASANKEQNAPVNSVSEDLERKELLSYQYGQFRHYYEAMDWLMGWSHATY